MIDIQVVQEVLAKSSPENKQYTSWNYLLANQEHFKNILKALQKRAEGPKVEKGRFFGREDNRVPICKPAGGKVFLRKAKISIFWPTFVLVLSL